MKRATARWPQEAAVVEVIRQAYDGIPKGTIAELVVDLDRIGLMPFRVLIDAREYPHWASELRPRNQFTRELLATIISEYSRPD